MASSRLCKRFLVRDPRVAGHLEIMGRCLSKQILLGVAVIRPPSTISSCRVRRRGGELFVNSSQTSFLPSSHGSGAGQAAKRFVSKDPEVSRSSDSIWAVRVGLDISSSCFPWFIFTLGVLEQGNPFYFCLSQGCGCCSARYFVQLAGFQPRQ